MGWVTVFSAAITPGAGELVTQTACGPRSVFAPVLTFSSRFASVLERIWSSQSNAKFQSRKGKECSKIRGHGGEGLGDQWIGGLVGGGSGARNLFRFTVRSGCPHRFVQLHCVGYRSGINSTLRPL